MHLIKLFFIFALIFFINISAFAFDYNILIKQANHEELYKNKIWKSLLYIKNKKSIIKDNNFFLSKTHNSRDELDATIKSFFENPTTICKFPARFEFIVKNLNVDKNIFPNVKCPELDQHLKKISPQKIHLVFATENITSPISMMGHLLIKISGYNEDEKRDVNHGLSYLAVYQKGNFKMKFYFDSLFFNSTGFYTLKPYNEVLEFYNDSDDRNIEEYELDFTQEQVENFVKHIWELKDIDVPYNFITHNCGTASIDILSSVDERFYGFSKNHPFTSPVDALKIAWSLNAIRDISIYPSDSYKIKLWSDNFSLSEKIKVKKFVETNDISIFNANRKNELLFISESVASNKYVKGKIPLNDYIKIEKTIADNFDGLNSLNLKQNEKITLNNPFSSYIGSSFERYKDNNILSLSFRPVYRDITDDNSQLFNNISLNIFKTDVYYNFNNDRLFLKNFTAFELTSLTPTDYLLKTWSFSGKVGFEDYILSEDNDINFMVNAEIGKTFKFFDINVYFLIGAEYFKNFHCIFDTGMIFNFTKFDKTIINYKNNFDYYEFSISENFYLSDVLSLNFNYETNEKYKNFSGGFKIYF